MTDARLSIGVEEEFFVFDAATRRAVRHLNKKFLNCARGSLGDMLKTEMLQSQIEIATPPCGNMNEVRRHLMRGRTALGDAARASKLGIAAVGTFPLAFRDEQRVTPEARYDDIMNDLQILGLRNMMCGMHVHVEVPDISARFDLIKRITPYLPLMLALSVSSPFWQGHLTGLAGYRLAAYDELPRTGLPELFHNDKDYDAYVSALVGAKIIPDASYIWWAIRPSLRFPTIELRIADSCTRLDDALAIASLYRCLLRAAMRDRTLNAGFDRVGRAITAENKWHAQRHGSTATFIDPMRRTPVSLAEWLDETDKLIAEDSQALDCAAEIAHLRRIVERGTSADRQTALYAKAKAAGRKRLTALKDVVDWVANETQAF